ncbi:ABC transporter permease [Gorillibacterium sp. sgz500922]|uniref:ABC transporter permease n=1 Tax=Gorillibacterium sp. sgz500922 TaxID=3446694 RepID=UPI003F663D0B
MKKKLFTNSKMVLNLARKDFQSRYLGSYLGILWAFIQPLIQILLFWFVFQVGFKSMPVDDFPFILWLICAMVPWFFFSDSIQNATNSILEYSYLVKKMVFRVSILPFVKILSAFFVHLFFICFLFLMFIIYGYYPNLYTLQVIYYLVCTLLLVSGLSLLTSTLNVFLKDTGQIVGVIIQLGFWLTPIFYSLKIVPEHFHFILKLNPMYYIVEGYRSTFIYHQGFWEHPWLTLNFWLITVILLVVGSVFFKKMRPHFADVL